MVIELGIRTMHALNDSGIRPQSGQKEKGKRNIDPSLTLTPKVEEQGKDNDAARVSKGSTPFLGKQSTTKGMMDRVNSWDDKKYSGGSGSVHKRPKWAVGGSLKKEGCGI
ncbi:hypothetical protein V6N13_063705 [Hibiscus sabdariffa]|uniref:Uncharacterized protein n=1 Tax=Hibiscus sabdariffa TaxID=183260 RepID=A0ABR2R1P4_9ROSI